MSEDDREIARRRGIAEAAATDQSRWRDPAMLDPDWDGRAKVAAELIADGARVLDLGCGAMALERYLPTRCAYQPCDLASRDARTIVCDFNAGEFPDGVACDTVVALGVMEYLADAPGFLKKMRGLGGPVIVSYNVAGEGPPDRRALGWANDYARRDIAGLLHGAGFERALTVELGGGQVLMRLTQLHAPVRPEKSVWVISYADLENFGDRLGVQLLTQVLPSNAVVRHISHNELACGVPEGSPDLIILGIGNSLFAPLLTPELLATLERAPRRIGIFGTQYRDQIPTERLQAVLDRMDSWYARYAEDALIYGRGRSNVKPLGDWLIEAFPMARPTIEETLHITAADVAEGPLDRMIQRIQSYQTVASPKLHPLLCALTSAEGVAYVEQEEFGGVSGKFRSLLMDVFGRAYPPRTPWLVDRMAVVAYKAQVARNIQTLKAEIETALNGP